MVIYIYIYIYIYKYIYDIYDLILYLLVTCYVCRYHIVFDITGNFYQLHSYVYYCSKHGFFVSPLFLSMQFILLTKSI